ncbi:MAG: immunoglobulin domain-containing protein [Bacteroidota bacterium]
MTYSHCLCYQNINPHHQQGRSTDAVLQSAALCPLCSDVTVILPSKSSPILDHVIIPGSTVLREKFGAEPRDLQVAQSEPARLTCDPPPGQPPPEVTWERNGHLVDLTGSERLRVLPRGDLVIQGVRHHDQGWNHYANAWEVLDPKSGKVLATRVLAHPHDQEQPFTRSLGNIRIPDAAGEVVVRARCNQHGFMGKQVTLVRVGTEGKRFEALP